MDKYSFKYTLVCFPLRCLVDELCSLKGRGSSYLLQTQNECLGTLDFINLSCFSHGLLNDISIIIVILRNENI